jgi:hypothetical protein
MVSWSRRSRIGVEQTSKVAQTVCVLKAARATAVGRSKHLQSSNSNRNEDLVLTKAAAASLMQI